MKSHTLMSIFLYIIAGEQKFLINLMKSNKYDLIITCECVCGKKNLFKFRALRKLLNVTT